MIEYQTKDGRTVRVFDDTGTGPFPLLGAYPNPRGTGWTATQWSREGLQIDGDDSLSLVMKKRRLVVRVRPIFSRRGAAPMLQWAYGDDEDFTTPEGYRALTERRLVWEWVE